MRMRRINNGVMTTVVTTVRRTWPEVNGRYNKGTGTRDFCSFLRAYTPAMAMNITIENVSVSAISFDAHQLQSRISPLFFTLNSSSAIQSYPHNSTVWLSVMALYHCQSYATFVEFVIDSSLAPTIDAILAVDFLNKCCTHLPAFVIAAQESRSLSIDSTFGVSPVLIHRINC
jgi:hypothetical protein